MGGKEVRFKATDEEYAEIEAYVKAKKQWRKTAHFVRYAVFRVITQNPVGRHGAVRTEAPDGNGGQ